MLFCRVGPAPDPTGEANPGKSGPARPRAPRPGLERFGSHVESLGKQDCCVCGGGLICLAVRLFFSVFLALFSRFPFSHCFSCFLPQLSFLSFPFSVSLYSAPDFLFLALLLRFCFDFRFSCSALPHCLAWARDRALMARLARAKQPWPAVRLCRCAPRLASGLAPRCADCSSLPLCALGRRLGARRARIQFPDAPPGSSEPGGR